MSTALIERDPPAADEAHDSIDTWLAVLVRLLHVSPHQSEAIRDEIEAHLRERVRDLMIAGVAEHDAIRTAISELGEVAELASRFSHASKLRIRRTIMNIAVLGVGAVGIATATIMFNGPQQPDSRLSVFQPPATASTAAAASALNDRTVPAPFNGTELGEVLRFLAQAADLDMIIDRNALEEAHIALHEPITLNLSTPRPLPQVLDLVAAQLDHAFAWRAADGILEISTAEVFDRREIVLASFDVQNVLDLIWATSGDDESATERLESLIIEYVEPYAWQVNGGDLANVSVVGGKMFVKSPARFHEPIQWILGQLEESAAAQASRPAQTRSSFGLSSGSIGAGGRRFSTMTGGASSGTAPGAAPTRSVGGGASAAQALPPSALDPTSSPAPAAPGLPATGAGGGGAVARPWDPLAPRVTAPPSSLQPPAKGPEQPSPIDEPADEPIDDPTETQTGSGGGK